MITALFVRGTAIDGTNHARWTAPFTWVRNHIDDVVHLTFDFKVEAPVAVDARLPDVANFVVLLGL